MPKYAVPIIYKGLSTYIVEASSPAEAADKARRLYENADPEEPCSGWEQVERVGDIEIIPD